MLLLGLAMAAVTLGFNFYLDKPNVVYADVSPQQREVTRYLSSPAFHLLFLPFPAAPDVDCLKMEKRCRTSQECVWTASPAQHRPRSVT